MINPRQIDYKNIIYNFYVMINFSYKEIDEFSRIKNFSNCN